MRAYKVQVDGRTYTVTVERTSEDRFRVTLNGEMFESQPIKRGEISSCFVRSGEKAFRAQTRDLQSGKVDVWLAGVPFSTSVQLAGMGGYPIATERSSEGFVGGEIRAPMPGRVTSILVNQGDPVELDTPLLAIEAMKMQNEIVSPVAGRVKSIRVQEGAVVKKDSVLIEIESN